MSGLRTLVSAPCSSQDGAPDIRDRIRLFCGTASFEVAARDMAGLEAARQVLPPGVAVSVTWLPTDNDQARIAMAVALRDAGFEPVPHIAARRVASAADLDRLLGSLRDQAGVDRALIIAGDVPAAVGPYSSSLQILESGACERAGFKAVGFGVHPEGHPSIDDKVLGRELDAKIQRAGDGGLNSFLVTQFCFAAAPIFAWIEKFRLAQPSIPIRIGLAGPASLKTLLRFAVLCGIGASAKAVVSRAASFARLLGEAGPDPVIRDIAAWPRFDALGPVGLHLFPFGGLARTARWNARVVQGHFRLRPSESGFEVET